MTERKNITPQPVMQTAWHYQLGVHLVFLKLYKPINNIYAWRSMNHFLERRETKAANNRESKKRHFNALREVKRVAFQQVHTRALPVHNICANSQR